MNLLNLLSVLNLPNLLRRFKSRKASAGVIVALFSIAGVFLNSHSNALDFGFKPYKPSRYAQQSQYAQPQTTTASTTTANTNTNTINPSQLPKEARTTLQLIQVGGPFPYADKDGSVFSNREQVLPKQRRGYYTEYTVKTPYAKNRGARRIIAGQGATGNPATSGEYFYTDDHYASFKRIDMNADADTGAAVINAKTK